MGASDSFMTPVCTSEWLDPWYEVIGRPPAEGHNGHSKPRPPGFTFGRDTVASSMEAADRTGPDTPRSTPRGLREDGSLDYP